MYQMFILDLLVPQKTLNFFSVTVTFFNIQLQISLMALNCD